jgi:hypothetical protein
LFSLAGQMPCRLTLSGDPEMPIEIEALWPESNDPLPLHELIRRKVRADRGAGCSLNYSLFVPARLVADGGLLQRAALLVRAITSRARLDQGEVLLLAAESLYSDMPQTWATWNDPMALKERRPPDEQKTFAANAWHEISDWISAAINNDRQIVFLVPLVSTRESPPDLPGPNDATLSPLDLLEMADAALNKTK